MFDKYIIIVDNGKRIGYNKKYTKRTVLYNVFLYTLATFKND